MRIVPGDERCRIAERVVLARRRNLREAHIPRNTRRPLQPGLRGEVHALVPADLSPGDVQPAEAKFVNELRSERAGVPDRQVSAFRRQQSAEAGYQVFVEDACPKRLGFVGVKRAEAGEEIVAVSKSVVETYAELI